MDVHAVFDINFNLVYNWGISIIVVVKNAQDYARRF